MFRPGGRPCKDWGPSMLGFPRHKICRRSCYRPLLSQHRRPSLVRQWHIVGGSCHPLWWTSHSTRWPTSTHLVFRKSCVGICHKRKMARLPLTGRFHLSRIRPRTMKVISWGIFVNIFLKDLHNQIFLWPEICLPWSCCCPWRLRGLDQTFLRPGTAPPAAETLWPWHWHQPLLGKGTFLRVVSCTPSDLCRLCWQALSTAGLATNTLLFGFRWLKPSVSVALEATYQTLLR